MLCKINGSGNDFTDNWYGNGLPMFGNELFFL
jgi:hypothetical protein